MSESTDWSLEEQVAQLFVLGYTGDAPQEITQQFLSRGLGGLIFFRDNFDRFMLDQGSFKGLEGSPSLTVRDWLHSLSQTIPPHLPRPFLSIDQEGGQVERLPHILFPTGLTPTALALSPEPDALAETMYDAMAHRLVDLGFNMNYFPTLDVNLNRKNPIIGVRSFGSDPETVIRLSGIALKAFHHRGLIAVGKHFPGHGDGVVDSHLDLPQLRFSQEELSTFQHAIAQGLPAMLVAHGLYPELQPALELVENLPSSASPTVIQKLLRHQCGFNGVIITDDMCMGAMTRHRDPAEAAIACLKAGVDILLYKQSTASEWEVYEVVVEAFKTGLLPIENLHASLNRIATLKHGMKRGIWPFSSEKSASAKISVNSASDTSPDWSSQTIQTEADDIARRGIGVLYGDPSILPLLLNNRLLLVHPERDVLGNYAFDVASSPGLEDCFRLAGFQNLHSIVYPHAGLVKEQTIDTQGFTPDTICLITFNPYLHPIQVALYEQLKAHFPQSRFILASAGTPYDRDLMPHVDLHLSLCSYRPATLRALASFFSSDIGMFSRLDMKPD